MKHEIRNEAAQTVLVLREQLSFADRAPFEGLIPALLSGRKPVCVELSGLDYMDSSGLGTLLTLRDAALKNGLNVTLRAPQGDVKELLSLSCFDTLFRID